MYCIHEVPEELVLVLVKFSSSSLPATEMFWLELSSKERIGLAALLTPLRKKTVVVNLFFSI